MGIKGLGNQASTFGNKFVKALGGDSTGKDAVNPYVPASGHEATGGIISDYTDPGSGDVYRSHIFTSTGTFVVSDVGDFGSTVDVLLVGGGGGGGSSGGGGGAGGFHQAPLQLRQLVPINIGAEVLEVQQDQQGR